eukprot:TRINITY_DN78948_c0_g1_i1.p2 TRINITY_DN78948_c0_g1~~TRINITY_DN78948_c0_g1_i1.p2  ORF type:complete len:123 (+),score=18.26 TRINITY_DN78948_c0_g1_i1:440-808(+)
MRDIKITDDKTIKEVQQAFQEHFPYLKLEFYAEAHEAGQGTADALKINISSTIGEARTKESEGNVSIHGNQKVSTLESVFHDVYGLNVQVFRRSGSLWLQTTTTDSWTLSEQNETAREFAVD